MINNHTSDRDGERETAAFLWGYHCAVAKGGQNLSLFKVLTARPSFVSVGRVIVLEEKALHFAKEIAFNFIVFHLVAKLNYDCHFLYQ